MNNPDPLPPPDLLRDESTSAPYQLSTLTGARALVLAPHPDDEVLGCGGALCRHTRAGDPVRIVFLTDGRHGHGPGPCDEAALIATRRREATAAAAALGVHDLVFWDAADRALGRDTGARDRLGELLEQYKPDLIYCPSPLEHHPDHRAAAWLLWQNAGRGVPRARVAFCEITRPLAVNTLVDVTAVMPDKERALACHASQLAVQPYAEFMQGLNRFRTLAVAAHARAVEGFFVTPLACLAHEPLEAFHAWQQRPLEQREALPEPLVSVIVRTRNRPERLREALASVRDQTGLSTEVVVVNDGGAPVDTVVDAFRGALDIRLVVHPQTRGRAAAANAGLHAARGRYVNFLDDDDLFLAGHLAKLSGFLESTGEDVAYSDVVPLLDERMKGLVRETPYAADFDPGLLRVQNLLPIHAVMFRRALLDEVGLFDESFAAMEDWDFWIRLSALRHFHRLPGVTACTRALSVHDVGWRECHRRIYEKHLRPGELADGAAQLVAREARLRDLITLQAARIAELEWSLHSVRGSLSWRLGPALAARLPAGLVRWLRARLDRRGGQVGHPPQAE